MNSGERQYRVQSGNPRSIQFARIGAAGNEDTIYLAIQVAQTIGIVRIVHWWRAGSWVNNHQSGGLARIGPLSRPCADRVGAGVSRSQVAECQDAVRLAVEFSTIVLPLV